MHERPHGPASPSGDGPAAAPLCRLGQLPSEVALPPAPPREVVRIHVMRELLTVVAVRALTSGKSMASIGTATHANAPTLYVDMVDNVDTAPLPVVTGAPAPEPSPRRQPAPTHGDNRQHPPARPPAGRSGGREMWPRVLAGVVLTLLVTSVTVAVNLTGSRSAIADDRPWQPPVTGSAAEPPLDPAPAEAAPAPTAVVAEPTPRQPPRTRPAEPPRPEQSDGSRAVPVPPAPRDIPAEVREAIRQAEEQWRRPSTP